MTAAKTPAVALILSRICFARHAMALADGTPVMGVEKTEKVCIKNLMILMAACGKARWIWRRYDHARMETDVARSTRLLLSTVWQSGHRIPR